MTDPFAPTHAHTVSRRNALIAAVFLGLGTSLGSTRAQSDAPQDAVGSAPAGVAIETLCASDSRSIAGKTLAMLRVTIHPGSGFVARPHPGPFALIVETGHFETEMLDGFGRITRALVDGVWQEGRDMSVGDTTRLSAGDHLFHDDAVYTVRPLGDESLVLLVATLVDTESAGIAWLETA